MDLPPLPHDIPLGQPATPSPGSQQGQTGTQLQDFPIIWPPPPLNIKVLRAGCWLVNYRPVMAFNVGLQYDGTLRLQVTSNNITLTASGDLYNRPPFIIAPGPNGLNTVLPGPAPKPGRGIPILPIKDYRYYLRVTKMPPVLVFASSFTMEFERYAFDPTTNGFKTTTEGGTTKVAVEGTYTASMKWVAAPAGYPDSASYLEGDVSNVKTPGTVAGRLKMGWIAQDLRKMSKKFPGLPVNSRSLTFRQLLKSILATDVSHRWPMILG